MESSGGLGGGGGGRTYRMYEHEQVHCTRPKMEELINDMLI